MHIGLREMRWKVKVHIPTLISSWSFDSRVMVSCSDMIAGCFGAVLEYRGG